MGTEQESEKVHLHRTETHACVGLGSQEEEPRPPADARCVSVGKYKNLYFTKASLVRMESCWNVDSNQPVPRETTF